MMMNSICELIVMLGIMSVYFGGALLVSVPLLHIVMKVKGITWPEDDE